MAHLTIQIIPSRPSPLRSHHTPSSPASPIKPQIEHCYHSPKPRSPSLTKSHPPIPGPWLWSCHKCRSSYPIGATRRCLHDGHHFCSGISIVGGRHKEHPPCGSIFDYQSWRTYASWRREACLRDRDLRDKTNEALHGCFAQCDFPSQCRWAPRLAAENTQAMLQQESQESIAEAEVEGSSSDEDDQDPVAAAAADVTNAISSSLSAVVQGNPAVQSIVRMLKSAERRTSHIANLFHPSESGSTVDVQVFEPEALLNDENEPRFSHFKDRMDKHHGTAFGDEKSFFEDDDEEDDQEEDDDEDETNDESDNGNSDSEGETRGYIDKQAMEESTRGHTVNSKLMDLDERELIRASMSGLDFLPPRDPLQLLQAVVSDEMDLTE